MSEWTVECLGTPIFISQNEACKTFSDALFLIISTNETYVSITDSLLELV